MVEAQHDIEGELAEAVRAAAEQRAPLAIVGGATKAFLGRAVEGAPLDIAPHAGVLACDPAELVLTARAGTPLAEIEARLAEQDQRLAFEPPILGEASTIGGVVAAGLSGAARPFAGAVRDFVLGVKILDGRGRALRFGGQVFKNVAGFDAFRLMAGAFGCLGVLLELSLRVSPAPAAQASRSLELDWPRAQTLLLRLRRNPLPLTGAIHDGTRLHLRFEGGAAAVAGAAAETGGEATPSGLWDDLRRFRLPVMASSRLWRVTLPPNRTLEALPGGRLIDWAGEQVWLATEASPEAVRACAQRAGGHATLFRGAGDGEAVFPPLAGPVFALHQRVKRALDPLGVLNPGRMYEGL